MVPNYYYLLFIIYCHKSILCILTIMLLKRKFQKMLWGVNSRSGQQLQGPDIQNSIKSPLFDLKTQVDNFYIL